jgi:hypothetical protein
MWLARTGIASRRHTDMLALQSTAEHAGLALACPFSSSDEFEADIIRARRAAGIYGRKRNLRYALCCAAAAMSVLIVCVWMI